MSIYSKQIKRAFMLTRDLLDWHIPNWFALLGYMIPMSYRNQKILGITLETPVNGQTFYFGLHLIGLLVLYAPVKTIPSILRSVIGWWRKLECHEITSNLINSTVTMTIISGYQVLDERTVTTFNDVRQTCIPKFHTPTSHIKRNLPT